MNDPVYEKMATGKPSKRDAAHSILFYVSVMSVAVAATGILVIFGLSAFNRVEPITYTTAISQKSKLPVKSNGSAKSGRDAISGQGETHLPD